jgi:hypothetical protein
MVFGFFAKKFLKKGVFPARNVQAGSLLRF